MESNHARKLALVASGRGGEVEGGCALLERAYRDHASSVFKVATHVGGPDLAEDVTQEVFLRYWSEPERFDPQRGSLGAFLTVMARSVAVDMLRANGARRLREQAVPRLVAQVGSTEYDVVWRALHSEVAARVREALQHLSCGERDAIVMAFFGELTYRQAAVALNAPEGTVKSHIRSGLRRLAAYVEAHDPDGFRLEPAEVALIPTA